MDVRVRVPTQLRDLVAGAAVVEVSVDDAADGGTTVAAVLDRLGASHPALERRIRDERGQMRPHVNVFVGADNVRDLEGTATPIRPGEEMAVIPAVSGG